jgi:hypothetical protein
MAGVPMALKSINVALKTPFTEIGGVWEPNDTERRAAWELYVELVTRVAVVPLPDDRGIAREALISLYQLFPIHREVLRKAGPAVAEPKRNGEYNLGYLSVAALNFCVRPFLATWHPQLSAWESTRKDEISPLQHERAWPRHAELRSDLDLLRGQLRTYAQWLSAACDVPDLLAAVPNTPTDRP